MAATIKAIELKNGESYGVCKMCDNPATHQVLSPSGVDAGTWCEQHAQSTAAEFGKGA